MDMRKPFYCIKNNLYYDIIINMVKNIIKKGKRGENMKTIFAQNLRKYRKICGMTQKALAEELHYSHTAIANYESGRNEPSLSDLCRLADVLGVSARRTFGQGRRETKKHDQSFSGTVFAIGAKNPEDHHRIDFSAVMGNSGNCNKKKTAGTLCISRISAVFAFCYAACSKNCWCHTKNI